MLLTAAEAGGRVFGSMGGGLDSDEVSSDHGCLPFAPPRPG